MQQMKVSPKLIWNKSRTRLRFEGSCLKQEDKATFYPEQCRKFIHCL